MAGSEIEYAWAAGFIDGDGYFTTKSNGTKTYLILAVGQSELEPLHRLQRLMGGNITELSLKRNLLAKKRHWRWTLSSRLLSNHIDHLWPHLTEVKKSQYERAKLGRL